MKLEDENGDNLDTSPSHSLSLSLSLSLSSPLVTRAMICAVTVVNPIKLAHSLPTSLRQTSSYTPSLSLLILVHHELVA